MVRRATTKDVADIFRIQAACYPQHFHESPANLQHYLDQSSAICYVAVMTKECPANDDEVDDEPVDLPFKEQDAASLVAGQRIPGLQVPWKQVAHHPHPSSSLSSTTLSPPLSQEQQHQIQQQQLISPQQEESYFTEARNLDLNTSNETEGPRCGKEMRHLHGAPPCWLEEMGLRQGTSMTTHSERHVTNPTLEDRSSLDTSVFPRRGIWTVRFPPSGVATAPLSSVVSSMEHAKQDERTVDAKPSLMMTINDGLVDFSHLSVAALAQVALGSDVSAYSEGGDSTISDDQASLSSGSEEDGESLVGSEDQESTTSSTVVSLEFLDRTPPPTPPCTRGTCTPLATAPAPSGPQRMTTKEVVVGYLLTYPSGATSSTEEYPSLHGFPIFPRSSPVFHVHDMAIDPGHHSKGRLFVVWFFVG